MRKNKENIPSILIPTFIIIFVLLFLAIVLWASVIKQQLELPDKLEQACNLCGYKEVTDYAWVKEIGNPNDYYVECDGGKIIDVAFYAYTSNKWGETERIKGIYPCCECFR